MSMSFNLGVILSNYQYININIPFQVDFWQLSDNKNNNNTQICVEYWLMKLDGNLISGLTVILTFDYNSLINTLMRPSEY